MFSFFSRVCSSASFQIKTTQMVLFSGIAILSKSVSADESNAEILNSVCFQDENFYNYTLRCVWGLPSIVTKLAAQCAISNVQFDMSDSSSSCFAQLSNKNQYCSGVFGGSICELFESNSYSYQVANRTMRVCIDDMIANTCQNGYGTSIDIVATVGLVCTVVGLGYSAYRFFSNRIIELPNINDAANNQALADENSPLVALRV